MGSNQNNEGDGSNNNQNNQEQANKGVQFQDSPNKQHKPPRVSMDGAATTNQDEDVEVEMSEPMSPPAKKRAAERSPHKSPSAATRLSKDAKLSTKFPVALNESKMDEPKADKTAKGMTQEEKIAVINDHEWKGELWEA